MKLDDNHHSASLMYYHLVLVLAVKYRRKAIDDLISDRLREIFCYISPSYNITLGEKNASAHGRARKYNNKGV